MQKCKLCAVGTDLKDSHILPKFIYKWITETSATGKLRTLGKPNVRIQDGIKEKMLCGQCEKKFGNYETWFARSFFHPTINGLKINYDYSEMLFRFAASIFWRTIIINLNREVYNKTPLRSELLKCESELRSYLNDDIYPNNFDHIYIGFTSYTVNAPSHLRGVNQYFTRSTDTQIMFTSSNTKMYFYSVIPYFIFIGNIHGLKESDFENSRINPIGGHFNSSNMILKEPTVCSFIEESVNRAYQINISDKQNSIIEKDIQKNIQKFANSKSFEAKFLDNLRED